ncbi:Myb-like [Mactra antiquata]
MADEGEIDVLGDFDFKLEADNNMYDANELPSKSANLLPEYTDPPWLLEQNWTLDNNCMDEKSKATIEKMLLEEQHYINGKTSRSKLGTASVSHADRKKYGLKNEQKKIVWTTEEKDMFHRGMEIYGRSWTKIAELIPTRTSIQIKNFAHQFFKKLKKDIVPTSSECEESSSVSAYTDPITQVLETVTTAEPTVPSINKQTIHKRGKNQVIHKNCLKEKVTSGKRKLVENSDRNEINGPKQRLKSKTMTHVHSGVKTTVNKSGNDQSLSEVVLDKKLTITPGLIENLEGFCAVADIIGGDSHESTNQKADSDDDIDIDIENDDESDDNPFLAGRSISPNSVYEKLILEASKNQSAESVNQGAESMDQSAESTELRGRNSKCETNLSIDDSVSYENNVATSEMNDNNDGKIDDDKSGNDIVDKDSIETMTAEISRWEQKFGLKREECSYRQIDSQKILVNALLREDGEVIHFPVPVKEVVLDSGEITEQEKEVLKEFFDDRPSKTPERYLKIRNFIIESWKKCKPNYLNKTSVRPGLKNCGDVNSIGRIHSYLECIGAVNFDCEQAAYNHPRSVFSLIGWGKINKDSTVEVNNAKLEAMRPRKRKVKDAFGVWIDEKDLEGITIEHEKEMKEEPKVPKVKTQRSVYDPFKLIPCLPFSEQRPAPFSVEIHSSSLIILDIHSHICKTEVIGLLGGKYCDKLNILTVTMATPCNSISTGMQCEMDPVSQTQASEEIRGNGMEVVGWYHSHPSFAPNPSVRDIETQLKFQEWFSKGGSNFVGIIVSPYNPRNTRLCSEVNCLTVSDEEIPKLQCNIPCCFNYTRRPCDSTEINQIILAAQDLATSYANFPNKVDLSSKYCSYREITCLEKMLESIKSYCEDEIASDLLENIRHAFTSVSDQTSHESTSHSMIVKPLVSDLDVLK